MPDILFSAVKKSAMFLLVSVVSACVLSCVSGENGKTSERIAFVSGMGLGWNLGTKRLRQRRKVLLPVPEGPMTEITSPGRTSRLMSRSTWSEPKDLRR